MKKLLAAVACVLISAISASASFHFWSINELYSSPDGSVQYVEFITSSPSQTLLAGHVLTCTGPGGTHSFTFSTNLPTDSLNKTLLVGTANLASQPGGVSPDYVFTNATPFLFFTPGVTNTVTLVGAFTVAAVYTNLPTDGILSAYRSGATTSFSVIGTNSPRNYLAQSNTLVPLNFRSASKSGTNIVLTFATATGVNGGSGANYAIEGNGVLGSTNWTTRTNVTGNGASKIVTLPLQTSSNTLFRLRVP